jgi:uncharacterized protein involved in exopolysaccharide biosynthesis
MTLDYVPEGASPGEETPSGFSLRQIAAIAWAYRRLSIAIAAVILLVGLGITKMLPKTYEATVTLMLNNSVKDPLAGKDTDLALTLGFIPTEIELMSSPEVLLGVIHRLSLTQDPEYSAGCFGGIQSIEDCVGNRLRKDLVIEQGTQGSFLINVVASALDPQRASALANAVADVYVESQERRLEEPDKERAQRYSQQLAELEEKVRIAQQQLTEYRQKTGLADLTSKTTVEEEENLTALQRRLEEVISARRSAEVQTMGDPAASSAAIASTPIQNLKGQLATQQAQLAQLSSTLGANHPTVLALKAQIDTTRSAIEAEIRTLSQNSSAEIAKQQALEAKLRAAIAEQTEKVLKLRNYRDEGDKYVLALESAQSVYKRALDGYDQIMFASAGKYNYVTIVSRAVPPQKSTRPNKPKLALLSVAAALGLALVIPFGFELLVNRRVRCADDLERALGIRVIASFGRADALEA